jgi:cell wall-associated protease
MRPHPRRLLALAVALALAASLAPVPAFAAPASPAPAAPRAAASAQADSVIVQYGDSKVTAPRVAALAASGVASGPVEVRTHGRVLVHALRGQNAETVARTLSHQAGVRWAVPNIRMHATGVSIPPNDTYYGNPYGGTTQRSYLGSLGSNPHSIDLEPAWQQAFDGADHAIDMLRQAPALALVDTGYTATNETPAGVFVPVYNYIAGNTDTSDDDGHGTTVGNVMHAQADNGRGIAGVQYATPSKVLVFKVLDANGNGSMDDVMSGIKNAADHGAKVINCSLGGSGYGSNGQPIAGLQQAWDDTIAYAGARGALVVAASGNENAAVDFPAAASGAISVGAIDPANGQRSSFSNFGPQLSLVAPGQSVLVYSNTGSTLMGAGTSYSSPIVSASIGLLWSLLPKATPAAMTSAVLSTCRDLGSSGVDAYYGHGELDVWAAYQKLMATNPVQPPMSVSVSGTPGFATTLTWPAQPGSDVVYHYGLLGGPTYTTTGTSGQLMVTSDGTYTAVVSASASDMFSAAPAQLTFSVATGRPPLVMQRFAGADRYGTAASASRSSFPTGSASVVVASGENFPDALSASVLAYRSNAPLLLTHRTSLPQATADEITRLGASSAVLVGGATAVSDSVASAIGKRGPSVTRVAGVDRYETAELVALRVKALEGGSVPSATVVVASGETFPDALSASPMAAAAGYPILLTRGSTLPTATTRALDELQAQKTLLVGGPAAVSDAVASLLPSATRLGGADRYATSRAIADAAFASGILGRADLGLATGATFPDALAGGVLMARRNGAMVLAQSSPTFDTWVAGIGDSCTRLDVFGSDTVVTLPFATHVLSKLRGL